MVAEVRERIEKEGRPSPIDVHVGSRIRLRRTLLGLSQERLGEALGLTFQQVQKYERGVNRVGASRLFDMAKAMDVPVSFFFDDMPAATQPSESRVIGRKPLPAPAEGPPGDDNGFVRRETLELVRSYYRIGDPTVRKRLIDLMKSMSTEEAPLTTSPIGA